MGVALTSCTVPAAGKPTFQIGDDEMEMGVGIHGEPGRRRVKLTQRRRHRRRDGRRHRQGSGAASRARRSLLLVNGFGGTPLHGALRDGACRAAVLAGAGVKIARFLVGTYVTSLEMAGCSITVSAADGATLALWDAPVHTAALRWGV